MVDLPANQFGPPRKSTLKLSKGDSVPTAAVPATLTEKRAGRLHDDDLARRFARFPQGLPPGFDPKSLGALRAVAERPRGR